MYQIPAELIQAGGNTLRFGIQVLIKSILNKEELPQQWKESVIIPIYKRGDETDCITNREILLFPATYKILSSILLSCLTPYVDDTTDDYQCGFRRNISATDQIFCIRPILKKSGSVMG
jgi:hypothetical protein